VPVHAAARPRATAVLRLSSQQPSPAPFCAPSAADGIRRSQTPAPPLRGQLLYRCLAKDFTAMALLLVAIDPTLATAPTPTSAGELSQHATAPMDQPAAMGLPAAASTPPCGGMLPLHLAAAKGLAAAVVQQLLAAALGTASVADQSGRLPLHHAAAKGNAAVVQLLLDAAPGTASVADQRGRLPLHFAVVRGHAAVVQLLLAAAPATASAALGSGLLPLHVAALRGSRVLQSPRMVGPCWTGRSERPCSDSGTTAGCGLCNSDSSRPEWEPPAALCS